MSPHEFQNQLVNLESSLENFAYRFTSEKAEAKELVQKTFLKALLNQDKYVNHINFKAWTFTIMKNTYINDYKRKKRQKTFIDQSEGSFLINQVKSNGSDNPDSAYSEMELIHNIEQLNDIFRIPFQMLVSGYKYREIAEELNVKVGTIKSRIFLSRKQLMAQLSR